MDRVNTHGSGIEDVPKPSQNHDQITAEDIEKAGYRWQYIDQPIINQTIMQPFIINTDKTGGPGVHWICAVKLPKNILYIYDPLGAGNLRVDSSGNNVSKYLNKSTKDRRSVHYYPYPSQMISSTQCGWFSIFVADLIKKYKKDHQSPSTIDALIQSKFGKTADPGDQRLIHMRV